MPTFLIFFIIFKHGPNHPEMQWNFFSPLGDPPPSPQLPTTNRLHFIGGTPRIREKYSRKKEKKKFFALKHFLEPIYEIKKNIYSILLEGGGFLLMVWKIPDFFFLLNPSLSLSTFSKYFSQFPHCSTKVVLFEW